MQVVSRCDEVPHDPLAVGLRREQFSAIAARSGTTCFCSLGSFLAVAATFWGQTSHAALLAILSVLAALHGLSYARSRAWLSGPRIALSVTQLRLRVAITILIALTWSTALLVLMPGADASQRQLLIYVFAGLTTSAVLLAPILPAAIAMAGITSAALVAVMPLLHQSISVQHALMVTLFGTMTMMVSLDQNRDFRQRFESEATVREQKDTIALLLHEFEENAGDWLWTVDREFRLQGSLERFRAVFDCPEHGLRELDLRRLLDREADQSAEDIARFLAAIADRAPFRDLRLPLSYDGRRFWFCLSGRPAFKDDTFLGYRGIASNVTEAQDSADRISYLGRHDGLTELPNRTQLHETLRSMEGVGGQYALLCLDLDGFRLVNDIYGHAVGDELLTMVAARLRGCVRKGDMVARMDGDTFAILAHCTDAGAAMMLADRASAAIDAPFAVRDITLSVGLTIGIVMLEEDLSAEQALQAGEIALNEARRRGRGGRSVFEQSMADIAQERHLLQVDLRQAIEQDGLSLAFQPILDAREQQVRCVEVLVRWTHPRLGPIPPDRFIPLAEENGLIVALGSWVLRQACREAASWPGDVRVAVNFSPIQIRDPSLLTAIDRAVSEAALPAERLEIEITESVFLEDVEATMEALRAIRARGIRISLDDFGTGYSSLSYLRSFPFDKVKIDRSFVRDLSDDAQALSIIRAIIGMASSLGISTTGEGVETARQADMLKMAGCDEFQGYLFGRPCRPEEIGAILGRTSGSAAA